MAYSVDTKTKIATLDGQEYYPRAVYDGNTGKTEMFALTEDECKESKEIRDTVPAQQLEFLRMKRNQILAQSDWVVIKEREEGGLVSNFADWKKYRQELRDITKTYKSIEDDGFKWPSAPTE